MKTITDDYLRGAKDAIEFVQSQGQPACGDCCFPEICDFNGGKEAKSTGCCTRTLLSQFITDLLFAKGV